MEHDEPIKTESVLSKVKEYLQVRFDLIRLEVVDSTSQLLSILITFLFLVVVVSFFLFFISYATANYISTAVGIRYVGYFVVAGVYFVIAIVFLLIQNKAIRTPIMNRLIKMILKDFKPS